MTKTAVSLLTACLCLVPALTLSQPEVKSATYTISQVDRYNLQVVRISGRSITVDIEGIGRRRFDVPRDFVFQIDGQDQRLNQLRPGQRLHAYVTHTETGELMLVEHSQAPDGVVADTVPQEDTAQELAIEEPAEADSARPESAPAALPATGSRLPLLGLAGLLLTATGMGLAFARRRYWSR
jgi:hypothetical protein